MKILLAPSETKRSGGTENFDIGSLLFESLRSKRILLVHHYLNILQKGEMKELSELFGLKKESDILTHQKDIVHELTMKAIERYTGVAFEYLDYPHLDAKAQHYIDTHIILFSNLFGPIRASDLIPEYRLKQGAAIGDIKPEKWYREYSADLMKEYLKDEEILDLRAGFYDKFYTPKKAYTTLKFIKEGKVVSHWAKAYRGIVLREIAKAGIESLEEFLKLPIEGLSIQEIQMKKNKTEIIYNIG
ncbi:MAG: YaaA family protein [Campylobacterales bacterium]|nr:YaaA family protein [Campylobacterales bacterium]